MKDINVFGNIGGAFEEDMSASKFAKEMKDAGGDDVTIHVNSGGGSVFDANTMAETIRAYKGRVTASIEGLAASAASYFALTADEVVINPAAMLMIHNPADIVWGTAEDMRKTADTLDKVRSTISGQYARKTGMPVNEIERLMDEETWFTADEAVEKGFCDRKTDAAPVDALVDAQALARYRHAPKSLLEPVEPVAGDAGATMPANTDAAPDTGAVDGGAGAAPRAVCINGAFLRAR